MNEDMASSGTTTRPELVVDSNPARFIDPLGQEQGPPQADPPVLGRARVVMTLPLKNGPHLVEPALVLGGSASYVIDPQGNLIGESNAVWVQRLLPATVTLDTRRL